MFSAFIKRVLSFIAVPKNSKMNFKNTPADQEESLKLQKKFLKKEDSEDSVPDEMIDRKNQSMKDSQGSTDFSGSAYNGPGKMENEKRNSNMGQRNFES